MLVLTRKLNEDVFIDVPPSTEARRIVVHLCEIGPVKCRLGFHADKEITVFRSELVQGYKATEGVTKESK